MKKFSKIALSVAAVSAVTAAMAVSASAAMTAEYDGEAGTVTLTGVESTGQSQTLLVLDGVDLQTVAETNIKQIDQKDDGQSFGTVKVGTLEDGTYEVRIGGNGQIQKATFKVGEDVPTPGKTILVGDANQDGDVTGNDSRAILMYNVDNYTFTGDGELAADANRDNDITGNDSRAILQYNVDNINDSNRLVGTELEITE